MKKRVCFVFFAFSIAFSFCSQSTFSGKAYDNKGKHIFTEEYVVTKEKEKITKITTKFFDSKGSLIGEMSSSFDQESYLPKVEFKKDQSSIAYGSAIAEKSIEIFKANKKKNSSSKKLPIDHNMVVGHGFYMYILSKIDTLLSGKQEKMIFLQPNKLTSYTFLMKAEKEKDNQDIIHITLSLDNKLLKTFVSDIKLSIHKPSQQILSYEGTNGFLPDFSSKDKVSITYTEAKEL